MRKRPDISKETFIQSLIAGKSQTQAYLNACPDARNSSPGSVRARASKLMKDPDVIARMNALKKQAQNQTQNDFDRFIMELRRASFEYISPDNMRWSDKLRAMELYAKVCGYTDPKTKTDVEDLTPLADLLNADD